MMLRWFACLILLVGLLAAKGADAQSDFAAGNKAYEQGRFAEAATHYRAALTNGMAGEGTWFNLGNAEFKAGRLGPAIVAYRRAEQITPRDAALRANLHFARKKATGEDDPVAPLTFQILRFLTFNEWTGLAGGIISALFLVLAAAEMRGVRAGRGSISLFALLAVGFSAGTAGSYFDRNLRREGVVIVKQSAVRFGPLEDSQTAFQLNEGVEVQVTEATAEWLQIRDERDRAGWTRRRDITLVLP